MKLRNATIIVCLVDAAVWVFVAFATFMSGSDAATNGVTVLPTWLIHTFGWFLFAGLLAVGFASDWGDPGWFLYLSFPVLLFGLGLAIARMHKSK